MRKRPLTLLLAGASALTWSLFPASQADRTYAFSPYTHASASAEVWADAADGQVTILGRQYRLSPELARVFANPQNRPDWNAGAVGPDAFPDIIVGQMSIHPQSTGTGGTGIWLGHILDRAWGAQSDPRYSKAEREQILAFTYGYLTHAAGDVWGHTLVNEIARGPFPPWGEAIREASAGKVEKLSIIARHLFTEGYIKDATPGFDGTKGEDEARLYGSHYTDDLTPAVALHIPTRWVYESMLVDSPALVGPDSSVAMAFFSKLRHTVAALPAKKVYWEAPIGTLKASVPLSFIVSYLGYPTFFKDWITAIDGAEEAYPELSLAIAQGLFDPATRRYWQGRECPTSDSNVATCVAGITTLKTVEYQTSQYVTGHLIGAILSPAAKDLYDFQQVVKNAILAELDPLLDEFDAWLTATGIPATYDAFRTWAKGVALDMASRTLGIDVRELAAMLDSPSSKMDLTGEPFILHPVGGPEVPITLSLFESGDHEKLDQYLGLSDPHATSDGGGLADDVEFGPAVVSAYQNTVTMGKLALLDGSELDRVLSDLSGANKPYSLYGKTRHGNIMTTVLPKANPKQPFQWLLSLDGDHAWRDGSLTTDETNNIFGPRDAAGRPWIGAGAGNFPLFESCALRPLFASLFTDWELGTAEVAKAARLGEPAPTTPFARLGDSVSPDGNDPQPPSVRSIPAGNYSQDGITTTLRDGGSLSLLANDDYWPDSRITMEARWVPDGSTDPIPFSQVSSGASLTIPGDNGRYTLQVRASDPCHDSQPLSMPVVVNRMFPFAWVILVAVAAVVALVGIAWRKRQH